jgi:nucleoside permease NupC
MDVAKLIHSSLFTCGLVGVLMMLVAALAFLRNRRMIKERTGIIVIVVVLLLVLLALTVTIE